MTARQLAALSRKLEQHHGSIDFAEPTAGRGGAFQLSARAAAPRRGSRAAELCCELPLHPGGVDAAAARRCGCDEARLSAIQASRQGALPPHRALVRSLPCSGDVPISPLTRREEALTRYADIARRGADLRRMTREPPWSGSLDNRILSYRIRHFARQTSVSDTP